MLQKRIASWKLVIAFILAGLIILTAGKAASAQVQGGWRGEYFNNKTLSGSPSMVRVDSAIDFDWGTGSPQGGSIGSDNFSVRWTGTVNISTGRYKFVMATDDGGRLWVNGQLVIDKWTEQQGQYHEVVMDLVGSSATVQMEYYENQGGAKAKLAYMRLDGSSGSGSGPWRGDYFNNKTLSGQPTMVRNDGDINFNWGLSSPAPGTIYVDNFSVRWTRSLELLSGRYQFAVKVDDGVRLWVNNQLIIDQWKDQTPTTHRGEIDLYGGSVPVKMEYYESTGEAIAQLSWALISGGTSPTTGAWRAEYFNNTNLSGSPVLTRDEGQPNYSWGYGSPAPGIVAVDNFSARWTRSLDFTPGRYRFTIVSDDGARLWVNNQLIIDKWNSHAAQSFTADIDLAGGSVPVRFEYYEASVLAEARLSWQPTGPAANTGGASTAVVATSSLNVRQGPGTSYAIISKLTRGQVVQLAGFRNADASWVKVILPDGRQGWSYAGYLQSSYPFSSLTVEGAPVPPAASGNTATVTNANYVNLRQGPGTSYSIITALPRGTAVTLVGRNAASSWINIRTASGTAGWMNGSYLSSTTLFNTLPVTG